VLAIAKSEPDGFAMEGVVALDSYYPLPWILGDFTRIGWFKKDTLPQRWDADFFVVDSTRGEEVEKHLTQPYFKRTFRLRSGQEECTVYLSARRFAGVVDGEPEIQPTAAGSLP